MHYVIRNGAGEYYRYVGLNGRIYWSPDRTLAAEWVDEGRAQRAADDLARGAGAAVEPADTRAGEVST